MRSDKCVRCNRKARIELRYSGGFLCDDCFTEFFEKRVRKTIRTNRLLKATDKMAVALSGGSDSATALYLLNEIGKKIPGSELIAVSIDQGIGRYREKGLRAAEDLCKKLGVKQYIYRFRDEFNTTIDGIVEKTGEPGNAAQACKYCRILRERLLYDKAVELGVTKIAVGQTLDDEIHASMTDFIVGDLGRIVHLGATVTLDDKKKVSTIKPLRDCPEEEVRTYAGLKGIDFEDSKCPYSGKDPGMKIKDTINRIEERHPGSRFQILKATDQLIPILRQKKINRCRTCKHPASGKICEVCQIKEELGLY